MRPQEGLWICRYKAEPTIAYLSSTDASNAVFACTPVSDVPAQLRAGYWLWKAFQWIEGLPL